MSESPSDRQRTLQSWMEQVDPKFRADTHWLLTHDVDSDPYWKWDKQPRNPNDFAGMKKEKFCGGEPMPRPRSGCSCNCRSCQDCGMSMCNCRCSTVRSVLYTCGHHKGKLLLILLLLVVMGVLVMNEEK